MLTPTQSRSIQTDNNDFGRMAMHHPKKNIERQEEKECQCGDKDEMSFNDRISSNKGYRTKCWGHHDYCVTASTKSKTVSSFKTISNNH